jgi:hypothetical protein
MVSPIAIKVAITRAKTLIVAVLFAAAVNVYCAVSADAAKPITNATKPMVSAAKPTPAAMKPTAATTRQNHAATGQIEVWCIKQKGDWLGEDIVYLCDSAFKTVYTKAGYAITMRAPDWKPMYYSKNLQTYFPETQEAFKKSFASRAGLLRTLYVPGHYVVSKGKTGKLFGYTTSSVVLSSKHPDGESKWTEVITIDSVVDPPAVRNVFGDMFGGFSPNFVGRVCIHEAGHPSVVFLETESIGKTKVTSDFFDPPKGFKLARNEFEVTAGSGLVTDMIDDLGRAPSK